MVRRIEMFASFAYAYETRPMITGMNICFLLSIHLIIPAINKNDSNMHEITNGMITDASITIDDKSMNFCNIFAFHLRANGASQ